jgi:Uma2 family endonuclease
MGIVFMVSVINPAALSVDSFIATYLEDDRYELIDGELIDLEPTGLHEQVAGFIARKLNVEIDRLDLPWLIPMKCLIRPASLNSAFRPDLIVLDSDALATGPHWISEPVISSGNSIKLVVEVVSTNWQNDYARKVEEYEAVGIPEYWIVDYLGLGGKRYIGTPKQPIVTIYNAIDGEYQGKQYRNDDRLVSKIFPDLVISASQVFTAGKVKN